VQAASAPQPPKLRLDQVIATWFIAGALLLEGSVAPVPSQLPNQLLAQVEMPPIAIETAVIGAVKPTASISAQSYLVIDQLTGTPLLTKFDQVRQYPASTIKLLTALTVVKALPPETLLTLTAEDLEPTEDVRNVLDWQVGETVLVQDVLASLLIQSDNQSALILANHFPGKMDGLIAAMQQYAQELELYSVTVRNPIGLDDAEQLISARDLALLAAETMRHPLLAELVAQRQLTITGRTANREARHFVTNTNQLLWSEITTLGIKTGTTDLAGEVLVTQVEHAGHELVLVIMQSQDRYADVRALLKQVDLRFHWQSQPEFAYNGVR
jgi:D-alanyl-D-alanine carboxypeptidase (penicillin-binding protein 5/6)